MTMRLHIHRSDGMSEDIEIKAGGSYSVTYPASVKWDGGGASNVAPLLSTNTTVLNFYTRDGGNTIYGSYAFADLNV